MANTPQAGWNAKVRIGSSIYTTRRYSVRDSVGDNDVSNTEGNGQNVVTATPGFETHVAGLQVAEITITNASFDPGENPFLAPRNIAAGAFLINLFIFLNGLGGVSWQFPSVLVTSVSQDGDAQGLQPLTFTAKSNGLYTRPLA